MPPSLAHDIPMEELRRGPDLGVESPARTQIGED